ncbi:MAG: hypothetical protein ACPLPS_10240 [bacterium]
MSAAIFDAESSGVEADGELGMGAFCYWLDLSNNLGFWERAIKFAEMWRKWGSCEKYPRLVGVGNPHLAAAALKSVDVFVAYVHGNGYAIQFGEGETYSGEIWIGPPPQGNTNNSTIVYLGDKNVFPFPLSKLDLVVIASCNHAGAPNGQFPIVEELKNMGAKASIGITGYEKFLPKDSSEEVITLGGLTVGLYEKYAEKFWKYATDGYVENGTKVYPTVREAAKKAYWELKKIYIPWQDPMGLHKGYLMPPFFYGTDDYLGNLVLQ